MIHLWQKQKPLFSVRVVATNPQNGWDSVLPAELGIPL